MGDDQKTITVAELSDGPPLGDQPDQSVDLPVVEILTGRGFITGKSGSGKSNTASVVAEKLLDNGFGILIVDIDGEYYGLKEEYEILHVGADEECDIQVTVEHAGKIASLALEQNVPIILDVSSFLDEDEAEELLTEVAKQLFAKEKKHKQPFLMLVEECHEWIPEKGSVGEVGKMLIKIGKRGRKHGLGIVGISQRPADVKKDFITQCDWLVWHRLTWNNDTKVVSRILDSEYSSAVEDLNDGEAFMMTDWSESVRRAQFHRKQTFDAGATPGLEDVDRPDLKSVNSDLVSELEEISEQKQQTEDRIAELREELDKKNSRIAELETELQDARDMSRMADQFVDALVDTVQGPNPGQTEQARMRQQRRLQEGQETLTDAEPSPPASSNDTSDSKAETSQPAEADATADSGEATDEEAVASTDEPAADSSDTETVANTNEESVPETDDEAPTEASTMDDPGATTSETETETAADGAGSVEAAAAADTAESDAGTDSEVIESTPAVADSDERARPAVDGAVVDGTLTSHADDATITNGNAQPQSDDEDVAAAMAALGEDDGLILENGALTTKDEADERSAAAEELVEHLRRAIEAMPQKTRRMLRYYRQEGPAKPLDAHFAGGGDGDRTNAYAHNRTLRTHGFIEHVGRGHYDYRLRDLIEEEYPGRIEEDDLDALVETTERPLQD
ncbi:MAG: helicase HerA domain-containing protein [Halorientalis sp.]